MISPVVTGSAEENFDFSFRNLTTQGTGHRPPILLFTLEVAGFTQAKMPTLVYNTCCILGTLDTLVNVLLPGLYFPFFLYVLQKSHLFFMLGLRSFAPGQFGE